MKYEKSINVFHIKREIIASSYINEHGFKIGTRETIYYDMCRECYIKSRRKGLRVAVDHWTVKELVDFDRENNCMARWQDAKKQRLRLGING